MSYTFQQSPHRSSRRGLAINAIILHFTASATLMGTMKWFQAKHSRVSAHYVMGRDGRVVQMVHEGEKAWHAGAAKLEGDPRVNSMSIGIEIVNWGSLQKQDRTFYCWPGNYTQRYDIAKYGVPVQSKDGQWWAPYTEEQRQALVKLCGEIVQRYPAITKERIVGHEDVAPGRKNDPGPALDMEWIRDQVFQEDAPDILPDSVYMDDDPSEEELAQRQQDRAEPMSWYDRVTARLNGFRG